MTLAPPLFTIARRIEREDGLDEIELRLADATYTALMQVLPNTGVNCMATARIVLPPEMITLTRGQTVRFEPNPPDDPGDPA